MSASYDPNHVTKLGELYDFLTGIWAKCKNMFAAKSDLSTVATSGSYNDLSDKPTIPAAQVQSDWNQSDNTQVDFIKNKPSIPAAQVQSDWNQTDNTQVDYIKNKPSIPTVPVQDVEYNGASVVNAQGVAEIPAPSYPVTDVTLDGTSVVSNGVAALTKEVFYLTMSNDPDADKALIDTAVAAGKAVILKYVDGQYTWELPLVIYKPTEIYRFCNSDYYRFVSVSLKYSSSAWTWENIFKKVVCPNYSSSDAGSILTVNSAGTATVWDPLATTAEIQAIVV